MEDNTTQQTVDENATNGGAEEQKTTATTEIDYKAEYEKMKVLKDKYSKESADWKNKYNSTLTDVEKAKIANEEREAHYKEIERAYNLGKISSGLSKSIGDENVVKAMAEKLLDGDSFGAIDDLNTYLNDYKETISKQTKESLLKDNPTPPPADANGNGGIDAKQFGKMTYKELVALKEKDPELYKRLANK